MKINFEFDEELEKKIRNITGEGCKDMHGKADLEVLESIIEDLVYYYNELQDAYDELQRDLQDNYTPIPPSEMYAVYDKDFY